MHAVERRGARSAYFAKNPPVKRTGRLNIAREFVYSITTAGGRISGDAAHREWFVTYY
jgi:hypothetical protein